MIAQPTSASLFPPMLPQHEAAVAWPEQATALSKTGKRLGDLPLSLFPDAAEMCAAFASPKLARAWARAVVMYWSRLERLGGLDLSEPLYLLDLAPGGMGLLALGMLATLRDEMHACGMLGWPVRYVLCPVSGEMQASALLRQPALQPFAARGWLDHASWQARPGHPMQLGANRFALFGSRNPVVAVCAGGFSAMATDLYGVHYGKLLRAQVQAGETADRATALACDWQPLAGGEAAPSVSVLLDHYRASLISGSVLLSEPALALLDALSDFSAGRYLLLAADQGLADERQIRLNRMALPEEVGVGGLCLPVNFHALGLHQESAGARIAQLEWNADGCMQHLACRDDAIGIDSASWNSLVQAVDEAPPAGRWWHAVPAGSIEEINFRLCASAHDPWALQATLDGLDPGQLALTDDAAIALLQRVLARCWQHLAPPQRNDAGAVLAALLCHVGSWQFARQVLAEIPDNASNRGLLILRARVEMATGRSTSALRLLCDARKCGGDRVLQEDADSLHDLLKGRINAWEANAWYRADDMRDGDISLEPLDALHIPAWLRQYRDPNIAGMAGLAEIHNEADALACLDKAAAADGAEYAVMHRDHGLVGVVGMRCRDDMAHIHFWMGVDHQGSRFGSRAVKLLVASMKESRLRHIFTSVFEANLRSYRLLDRAGFRSLPHEAHGDDEGYLFMYLALPGAVTCAEAELARRLASICDCIGEPLVR